MNETIREVEALIQELNETLETIGGMIDVCEYRITEKILVKAYDEINTKIETEKNNLNWLKETLK